MNTNEKAPGSAATLTGAEAEKIDFGEANFPVPDSSTNPNKAQAIFDLLPQGETNAIRSKALAELVGAPSVRDLQLKIAAERENGKLILSTCRGHGGYFKASPGEAGLDEIRRYINTLRSRAVNTFRAFRGAKAAIKADSELSGQIDLDELAAMME